jgi:hypothetical protein
MPRVLRQIELLRRRRHANEVPVRGSSTTIETECEPTETLAFGLEDRLQRAGVRFRVHAHDVLSVPVPAHETGLDAEGRAVYEEVPLTQCVDAVLGTMLGNLQ